MWISRRFLFLLFALFICITSCKEVPTFEEFEGFDPESPDYVVPAPLNLFATLGQYNRSNAISWRTNDGFPISGTKSYYSYEGSESLMPLENIVKTSWREGQTNTFQIRQLPYKSTVFMAQHFYLKDGDTLFSKPSLSTFETNVFNFRIDSSSGQNNIINFQSSYQYSQTAFVLGKIDSQTYDTLTSVVLHNGRIDLDSSSINDYENISLSVPLYYKNQTEVFEIDFDQNDCIENQSGTIFFHPKDLTTTLNYKQLLIEWSPKCNVQEVYAYVVDERRRFALKEIVKND